MTRMHVAPGSVSMPTNAIWSAPACLCQYAGHPDLSSYFAENQTVKISFWNFLCSNQNKMTSPFFFFHQAITVCTHASGLFNPDPETKKRNKKFQITRIDSGPAMFSCSVAKVSPFHINCAPSPAPLVDDQALVVIDFS